MNNKMRYKFDNELGILREIKEEKPIDKKSTVQFVINTNTLTRFLNECNEEPKCDVNTVIQTLMGQFIFMGRTISKEECESLMWANYDPDYVPDSSSAQTPNN